MARAEVRVEVKGRDAALEAYRVETDYGPALVPEHLMAGLRPGDRPTHQEAYEWIAAHRQALTRAVYALSQGRTPKRPYNSVTRPPASSLPKYSNAPLAPHNAAAGRS